MLGAGCPITFNRGTKPELSQLRPLSNDEPCASLQLFPAHVLVFYELYKFNLWIKILPAVVWQP